MPEGPKKNSKMLIVGIVAVVIIVIIVAVAGMFLLGGACCLGSMILSPTSDPTLTDTPSGDTVTLFDESRQIPKNNFMYYEVTAQAGETLDIGVTTDGSAIDVMVMNSVQFDEYQDAVQGLNDGTWHTIDTVTYVVSKTVSYTVDEDDTYYVVFDNSADPSDGANAGQDVNAHMVIYSTL